MTRLWSPILCALLCSACGSSSPTAPSTSTPTPIAVPAPTPPTPAPIAVIQILACPASTVGVELGFYRQIGCNAFDQPGALQPVRRWTIAPKVYLRTVDDAGAPIDPVTLDTVQTAMIETAPRFTGGKFGLEGVLRGTDTREGQSGWITVKWPTSTTGPCGRSDVAFDGGVIELGARVPNCDFGCGRGAIRPRTARHELGHALGYWHTDSADDLMSGLAITVTTGDRCDATLSPRELAAAAYQYR